MKIPKIKNSFVAVYVYTFYFLIYIEAKNLGKSIKFFNSFIVNYVMQKILRMNEKRLWRNKKFPKNYHPPLFIFLIQIINNIGISFSYIK